MSLTGYNTTFGGPSEIPALFEVLVRTQGGSRSPLGQPQDVKESLGVAHPETFQGPRESPFGSGGQTGEIFAS